MKKVCIILVLVFALLASNVAMAGPALDKILARGELIIGTSGGFPPFTATTKDGKLIGFDIDLATVIAAAMGVKPNIVQMPFTNLLPALQSGKIDMIIASMTMVPERNLKVAYIGPYFISGQSIIFTRETALSVRKLKDINNAGFSVAVPAGTTSEMTAKMALPKTNLTSTKSMDDAIKLLLDGKVKAVIADAPTAAVVTYRYTEKGLISTEPLTFEPIGIAVSGNDPLLMNWLQNYIMILKGEGDLDFLVEKWFKDVSWVKDLQ